MNYAGQIVPRSIQTTTSGFELEQALIEHLFLLRQVIEAEVWLRPPPVQVRMWPERLDTPKTLRIFRNSETMICRQDICRDSFRFPLLLFLLLVGLAM
jgi:hypothetical protein